MSRKIKVAGGRCAEQPRGRARKKTAGEGGEHAVFVAEENTRRDGEGVEAAWSELERGAGGSEGGQAGAVWLS